MTTIVPRWEWRIFGESFGPAERVFGSLEPDSVQESDELLRALAHERRVGQDPGTAPAATANSDGGFSPSIAFGPWRASRCAASPAVRPDAASDPSPATTSAPSWA